MQTIREGLVLRRLDGSPKTDNDADTAIRRICRRLQAWLGHKRIDETMIYVHVAEVHGRELPEEIQRAAAGITDPDARVLAMLGARGKTVAKPRWLDLKIQARQPLR
jgi:hypothetical protein